MLLIMQKNLHMMNLEMMKVIEIIDVFNFMLIVLPLYPKTAEGYVDCFDAA